MNRDLIDLIRRAHAAGALSDADLSDLQAPLYPICGICGMEPSRATIDDARTPICPACYARRIGRELPSGESLFARRWHDARAAIRIAIPEA